MRTTLTRAEVESGSMTLLARIREGLDEASQDAVMESGTSSVLLAFAASPHLLERHQGTLATHRSRHVREALAKNESLARPTQAVLVLDECWAVRHNLAGRADLDETVLEVLKGDREALVRGALALNPICPTDVMALLARDPDPDVRGCVAASPALTRELALVLAGDTNASVRRSVGFNPSVEPSGDFPLEVFRLGDERFGSFMLTVLKGCDDEATKALWPGWTGTLEDLVETSREFQGA